MIAELVGLLGCALCALLGLVGVVVVIVMFVARRPRSAAEGPSADATFFASLGLALTLPKGWEAEDVGGQLRIRLPSGYAFNLVPGAGPDVLAKRAAWLKETPYRSEAQVLRHDERVFYYSAREDDLEDLSFVVWTRARGQTWVVETHGANVEHDPTFSPAAEAEKARLQEQLGQAMQAGEAMDGPVVQGILDRIGALASEAAQSSPEPTITQMSKAECEAAIRMVLSLREA